MDNSELNEALAKFYLEARTGKGEQYSRSALLGFRNAIERHLNNNSWVMKISKNATFQKSNKMLDAKLRINRREGKENVKHKPVIESADLLRIKSSEFTSVNNPAGLQRRVWFLSLFTGVDEDAKDKENLLQAASSFWRTPKAVYMQSWRTKRLQKIMLAVKMTSLPLNERPGCTVLKNLTMPSPASNGICRS